MTDIIGRQFKFESGVYRVVHVAQHTESNDQFAVFADGGDLGFYFLTPLDEVSKQEEVRVVSLSELNEPKSTYWEHFKSTLDDPKLYVQYGEAKNILTLDDFVLYAPLYREGKVQMKMQKATCLLRSKDNFYECVVRKDYIGPRFSPYSIDKPDF